MNRPDLDQLIGESFALEAEDAKKAGTIGYMARMLVQATLPHKATQEVVFKRENGAFQMSIVSPDGLPYGSIPRLLLSWMTTEAVRTRSPELVLGSTLSAFMAEFDLGRRGGKRGDITRFKNQAERLFSATISCRYKDENLTHGKGFLITDEYNLWWQPKKPNQLPLWKSTITLSQKFFEQIIERPVPVDMDAMMKLKRSPMALDIYFWLTYRLSYLHKDLLLPWPLLQMQFGADYAQDAEGQYNFKRNFLLRLKDVLAIYDKARVFDADKGLFLRPSPPHVAKRHIPSPPAGRGRILAEARKDSEAFNEELAHQLCLADALPPIRLKTFTYEKAKAVLSGAGLDIYALEADWLEWIEKTGKRPANPDAAFIGFCRKKSQKK
jgi:hypothetical protein